jgi:hypothetical protein
MTTIGELDLRSPAVIAVDGGGVSAHDGEIALATPSGEWIRERVLDLKRSDRAVYWTDGERLVIVGLLARDIVLAHPGARVLAVIGQLDRLDLSDTYDPGGLRHVRFVNVSPGRVAIVYEVGIAVADIDARLVVWQRSHDDVQALFAGISDAVAWFETEHGRFGFRIDDGAFQLQ